MTALNPWKDQIRANCTQDGYFNPAWGLTLLGRLPTPPLSDFLPVQDSSFITAWGLTPPGRPLTPLPGDIVPVQDGHFDSD
uniref:Uncharacterized protein n=1 Tax=Oryza punctata TaxID=4537 RepID=A0A0E0KNS7_ORYPU